MPKLRVECICFVTLLVYINVLLLVFTHAKVLVFIEKKELFINYFTF